jgi:acyl-coenzyme A synthetase/AMP-(fatty) acid ligase
VNVVDPIHEHARTHPQATALVLPRRLMAWSELSSTIQGSALLFHRRGLQAGQRVGLSFDSPGLHLVASLALAEIGAAHVALPLREPPAQRRLIAERLGLAAVISDSAQVVREFPDAQFFDRLARIAPDKSPQLAPRCGDAQAGWLILQSSGTTGEPKFAELSHEKAMARSARFPTLYGCGAQDVFWPLSRLDFVVAKQRAVYALHAGAAVYLRGFSPIGAAHIEAARDGGVTLACGTPSHMHQLLDAAKAPHPIPTLRAFEVRSATISEKLRAAFRESICEGLQVVYGTNEGEALAIAPPALQRDVPGTVGRATPSMEVQVVDESGMPLPACETGEVRARGAGVIDRYIGNPAATARSFRDGWFHPGDLAFMTADGAVVLQGRKDDMMIFDGMNIYPAEIENALLAHPAVREAAAYPVRHARLQNIPAAAVTLHSPVSEEELIRHCRERIGSRHPRRVRIMDELPRNAMGKVLKRSLAADAATAS